MKKWFKKTVAVVLTAAMVMSVGMPAFAAEQNEEDEKRRFVAEELNDITLGQEAADFLEQNGITDLEARLSIQLYSDDSEENMYVGILDEDILALKRAAEAHNFTEEQVQQYVEGLMNTPSEVVLEDKSASARKDSTDRTKKDGVGYEVQSLGGYSQATSYATLPIRSINNLQDIAYVFYTAYSGPTCMDFGVRGGMYNWVTMFLPKLDDNKQAAGDDKNINKKDGERIYFNINVEKNGVLRCRLLDANNFSNVLCDTMYAMSGVAKDKMVFNKQITFCNNNCTYTSGCKISNARFDQSYLYNTAGYRKMDSTNTKSDRCGRFGIVGIEGSREMVKINNSTQWDSEDITIHFNLK